MRTKNTYNRADGEKAKINWFDSLMGNLGGILAGGGALAKGVKGTQDNYYIDNTQPKNNTGVYLAIGGGILAVIVILALAFGGSKK